MRKFIVLSIVLMALPCFANDQKWYILNRESGCELLTEIHEDMPYTEGCWTPASLLNAVDSEYHDAKLVPFIDVVLQELKDDKVDEAEVKRIRNLFKNFTQSNAFILSSISGKLQVPLATRDLCAKLKVLPVEPEQWVVEPEKQGDYLTHGSEIPRESWYEVSTAVDAIRARYVSESHLKEKAFMEIHDDMMTYYAGNNYSPEADKRPYLVRGVSSGKAGKLKLFYDGEVLFVLYEDTSKPLYFAPLVVNLPSALTSVVILPYRGN